MINYNEIIFFPSRYLINDIKWNGRWKMENCVSNSNLWNKLSQSDPSRTETRLHFYHLPSSPSFSHNFHLSRLFLHEISTSPRFYLILFIPFTCSHSLFKIYAGRSRTRSFRSIWREISREYPFRRILKMLFNVKMFTKDLSYFSNDRSL